MQRLWEEHKAEYGDVYSYSRFCYHFQVWRNSSELTMHIEHKSGDKTFVDFTGKKLQIKNSILGEERDVEVFVAILGASQLTYVEAVESQKKADWIRVNENAFRYFGGVTRGIVPDCLKSGVTKGDKYEPDLNPEYLDFAKHYGTTILPARPYRPKDKALVENAVRIVYAWIFAPLRNQTFYSLKDLNDAISVELESYNSKPMQRLKISRRELFNETEKSELKPLPREMYEFKRFCKLKVQFNYHIFLSEDRHYYSVPYQHRGKKVDVMYTESTVDISYNHVRLTFHKRDRQLNGYTTLKEHMPSHHKWVTGWSAERLIKWADSLGDSVKMLVEIILNSREHPEQGFKVCLGILNMSKEYGGLRLNKACKRSIYFHNYSYKGVKNILKNGLEDMELDEELPYQSLPEHENIRGNKYYS